MEGKKLNASRTRLYAPKNLYHVEEPKKVKRQKRESDLPEFKVHVRPETAGGTSRKLDTVSKLNDETQVKKKPEISKNADSILKAK